MLFSKIPLSRICLGCFLQILVITASLLVFVIPFLLSSQLEFLKTLTPKHNYDRADADWSKFSLIPTVDRALQPFSDVINERALIKRLRIKGRHSPWFHHELTVRLRQKKMAWKKAPFTRPSAVILTFKQIRNRSLQAVRKSKTDYLKNSFHSVNLIPKEFGKNHA